jgi:hypothetical protein
MVSGQERGPLLGQSISTGQARVKQHPASEGIQPSAFLPLPTPTREADSLEARLGVFAHSVGATEAGGVDANVELLLPRLPNDLPEQYKFLVPRPQFGAMINTAGKTSYGYAGVVWTLNILPQFSPFTTAEIGVAYRCPIFARIVCSCTFCLAKSAGYSLNCCFKTWNSDTTNAAAAARCCLASDIRLKFLFGRAH